MTRQISSNIEELRSRISAAAERSGRKASSVVLLGASKNRSPEEIEEAVSSGLEVIGENRVQELIDKKGMVKSSIRWDFIGHLQRNKVKDVVGLVELIHSLDSLRLGLEIDRRAKEKSLVQPVLLQVNQGGEESKYGIGAEEIRTVLSELKKCRNIDIRGFSTVAPYAENAEEIRWVFQGLKRNMEAVAHDMGGIKLTELSMGMTNDYEVAVEEGATIVRIGTGIFGPVKNK